MERWNRTGNADQDISSGTAWGWRRQFHDGCGSGSNDSQQNDQWFSLSACHVALTMTNGAVQKGSGTTLVVHTQDGAQTISVPPNVPVTEVVREKVTFAVGDIVYAATEELPNGTLTTDKVFLIAAGAPRNS
jgi:hypothetical protein